MDGDARDAERNGRETNEAIDALCAQPGRRNGHWFRRECRHCQPMFVSCRALEAEPRGATLHKQVRTGEAPAILPGQSSDVIENQSAP